MFQGVKKNSVENFSA